MELVITILLVLFILVVLCDFLGNYFQESLRKADRQTHYIKEHLKMQQDFIDAYKDMFHVSLFYSVTDIRRTYLFPFIQYFFYNDNTISMLCGFILQ